MRLHRILLLCPVLLVVACSKPDPAPPAGQVDTGIADMQATGKAPEAAQKLEFDINQYPLSEVTLGAFPFVSLPAGYTDEGYGKTDKDFARFPFWVNGQAHWVEGRFHGQVFSAAPSKDFSAFEVSRNIEAMIKQMGGVKVSEARIPISVIQSWGDEITMGFVDGLGDVYNHPATTYLVRHPDGNIWLHLVTTSASGAYVIGQEQAFRQTAALLSASDLKKQIDNDGKVALRVNFATDKTDILPDSMPQIAQVVALLNQDAALKLAVNGHTDNTGDKARNQTLSEGRAKSVVAALVGQGIDAARLAAQGFGDSQPVADNDSEEGKAKNRRVELVKR